MPKLDPSLPATAPLGARGRRLVWRLIQGIYLHDSLDAASGMAFHFFLSLMPLLVVLGFVLGHVVQQQGVDVFLDPLLDATPGMATDLVRRELERLAGQHNAVAPLGFIGFCWLASSGIHGLMNAFEGAVGAPRRAWWKKRAIAIAVVVGALASICAIAAAFVSVDGFVHRFEDDAPVEAAAEPAPTATVPALTHGANGANAAGGGAGSGAGARAGNRNRAASGAGVAPNAPNAPSVAAPNASPGRETTRDRAERYLKGAAVRRRVMRFLSAPWERFAAGTIVLFTAVIGLAAFYRFAVSHPPGVNRRMWPGSFLAIFLFLVISWFFGMYVSTLGQYALYYGGLAAVAVLLFWFYLTSLALLIGAELNAQLEGIRD